MASPKKLLKDFVAALGEVQDAQDLLKSADSKYGNVLEQLGEADIPSGGYLVNARNKEVAVIIGDDRSVNVVVLERVNGSGASTGGSGPSVPSAEPDDA